MLSFSFSVGLSLSFSVSLSLSFSVDLSPSLSLSLALSSLSRSPPNRSQMASGVYDYTVDGKSLHGKYSCTSYTAMPCDHASVNAFGAVVTTAMRSAMKGNAAGHGGFLDSCFRHCSINCPAYVFFKSVSQSNVI